MAERACEERLLVHLADGRDAARLAELLSAAGLATCVCRSPHAAREELRRGAGALLLAEEALASPDAEGLREALSGQPAWSDLPLVVLARGDAAAGRAPAEGNVLLVERPVRSRNLLSAVRAALRARRRQYELRGQLAARERHEAELAAERATLAAVVGGMSQGVVILEPGGTLLSMNRAALALHGFGSEAEMFRRIADFGELFETTARDGTVIPVEDWPASRAVRGETVTNFEMHVRRRDTGAFFVGLYSSAAVTADEGACGWRC